MPGLLKEHWNSAKRERGEGERENEGRGCGEGERKEAMEGGRERNCGLPIQTRNSPAPFLLADPD